MLWTIFVILLVLWLSGLVTSYTIGGFCPCPSRDRRRHPRDSACSGTARS